MLVFIFVGGFLLTLGVALVLTPLVRELAHHMEWTDKPDGRRKIHQRHMPRVGGLAIVGAFAAGAVYFGILRELMPDTFALPSWHILVGGLIIAAAGFYDDVHNMHFSYKFSIQILLACLIVAAGYHIRGIQVPFTDASLDLGRWISVPLTILWIVGVINAVNLLDGMDGPAAGVSVIAFSSLAATYAAGGDLQSLVLVTIMVAALLGSLFYNFNPASIFMGDMGSLFIGFILATFSLRGAGHANPLLAFLIPILAMGLPVIDTALAIIRRFLEQRPLLHADRDHIHHRIAFHLGLSHRNTVLILYAASALLGLSALSVAMSDDSQATLILCGTGMVAYLALRFLGYLRVRETLRLVRQRYSTRTGPAPVTAENGDGASTTPTFVSPSEGDGYSGNVSIAGPER